MVLVTITEMISNVHKRVTANTKLLVNAPCWQLGEVGELRLAGKLGLEW